MYKLHVGGELIPNRIFVGGLPETSDDELKEYFSRICGPNHIVDLKYMEKFRGSPKGICFITFDSENEVAKFLSLNSELVFKNSKLKISNAYRRYQGSRNYSNQNQNYTQQNSNFNQQVEITYFSSSNGEESELCVMTPTPPIAQTEQTNSHNLNEIASSSSASSASAHSQSELNEEVKQKTQAVSSSSTSSVNGLNSELTTLTTINPAEKDSSSMLFSSSSSSSSTSSKSTSISNLNKSSENKTENLDSNNNKNMEQRNYPKRQHNDSYRSNNGQNRSQNYQRTNLNQRSNRFNTSFSSQQSEPLTVQTSNSRTQQQMASPYYQNHSNPISPIRMSQKQNQKQMTQQNKNYNKNTDMLKINTNSSASSYVGSVIGSVYPDMKMNAPMSSGGSKNYNQNSQSHSNVAAAAAEAIANYANQTASVNSSSILNMPPQSKSRQNMNPYTGEFMKPNTSNAPQTQQAQYVYPNFYYYTNPSALPMNQNNIYVDPSVQRSAQITGPLTPHSYNPYYQTQTSTGSNPDAGNSQATISNAFETANQNISSSLSVEQLDEMMQKNLNLGQYDPQQYPTQPVYYLAQIPNSQYYAYYYAPGQAVMGPNGAQSQFQVMAPVSTPSNTPSSNNSQINQQFTNPNGYVQQQQQQQIMPNMYMQQQMMGGSVVQPNSQPVPILQLPAISYYNSNQQAIMPHMVPQGQQYQYQQQMTQVSPQQQNSYPTNTQMYQYVSGVTPNGSSNMPPPQNRRIQNNQNTQRSN